MRWAGDERSRSCVFVGLCVDSAVDWSWLVKVIHTLILRNQVMTKHRFPKNVNNMATMRHCRREKCRSLECHDQSAFIHFLLNQCHYIDVTTLHHVLFLLFLLPGSLSFITNEWLHLQQHVGVKHTPTLGERQEQRICEVRRLLGRKWNSIKGRINGRKVG